MLVFSRLSFGVPFPLTITRYLTCRGRILVIRLVAIGQKQTRAHQMNVMATNPTKAVAVNKEYVFIVSIDYQSKP